MPAILATEAKRSFGHVLDRVSRGEAYTVMRRGRPVARIVPVDRPEPTDLLGALAAWADPALAEQEQGAFSRAMEAKHDPR